MLTLGLHPNLHLSKICADPSKTVKVDKQGMYHMAGKWKNGEKVQPVLIIPHLEIILRRLILHEAKDSRTQYGTKMSERSGRSENWFSIG